MRASHFICVFFFFFRKLYIPDFLLLISSIIKNKSNDSTISNIFQAAGWYKRIEKFVNYPTNYLSVWQTNQIIPVLSEHSELNCPDNDHGGSIKKKLRI